MLNKLFYLDNSATTKPCEEAVNAALNAMKNDFGNPSSLYQIGLNAENIITASREAVANALHCREDEVYFTSGGSESNNTAIFGAVQKLCRRGRHIVSTAVEHPSVIKPLEKLESMGYEVTYLKPNKDGNISEADFENAIRSDTILVSCMYVNNETGAIFPVDKIKDIIKAKQSPAALHIDCVQAFGKIDVSAPALQADLVSVSSHKIHGIKGAGALFVKKGFCLPAYILGGGQESGLRSGTEAVPAIAAFGAAVKVLNSFKTLNDCFLKLNCYAKKKLSEFENVTVNSPDNAVPYILNFSFTGYRSETILHLLESHNVFVSSGSACSKGHGSYVLKEMGLDRKNIDSAIRISFSAFNDICDIDALCEALKAASALRKSTVK